MTVVAPIAIIGHYVTKWKAMKQVTPKDEENMGSLRERAEKLEDRLESLERILYPSNYTIIWLADGGLAIHVLDEITTFADNFGGESESWDGVDVTIDARLDNLLI
ncbi:MAG: hypothetical protein IH901_06005, partial [Proteobacteria bacterium]|nr:hypothetical protein [Pseudomonadota bacterium]